MKNKSNKSASSADNSSDWRSKDKSSIDDQIIGLYRSCQPSQQIINKRVELIARLSNIISTKYGSNYSVESFGSTCYQVSSSSSDLDLVIIDKDRPHGFDPSVDIYQLPSAYNPNNLAKTLSSNNLKSVQPIFAAVPIVKFTDPVTNLQCDLNANNLFGIRNSLLIKSYLDLSPIARPLVLAIKHWAKLRGLNDSAGQYGPTTLSSYTLILMVISFLQFIGHLPNLQDADQIKAARLPEHRLWVRPPVKRRDSKRDQQKPPMETTTTQAAQAAPAIIPHPPDVRVSFDTTFVRRPLGNFIPTNLSLSTALAGFFYFYSNEPSESLNDFWGIDEPFNYETSIISMKYGGIIPRDDLFVDIYNRNLDGDLNLTTTSVNVQKNTTTVSAQQPLQWREQLLVTQDPFITTRNTSTNVRPQTSRHIIEEFQNGHKAISSGKCYDDICKKRTSPFEGEPGPGSFRKTQRKVTNRRRKGNGKSEKSTKSTSTETNKKSTNDSQKSTSKDKSSSEFSKPEEKAVKEVKRKRKSRKPANKSTSVVSPKNNQANTAQP